MMSDTSNCRPPPPIPSTSRGTWFWQRENPMSEGLWKGRRISEKVPEVVPFLGSWKRSADRLRMFQIILGGLATSFSIATATVVSGKIGPDYLSIIFAFIAAAAIGLMTAFDLGTKSNNMTNAWRKLAFAVMGFNNDQIKKEDVIKAWYDAERLIGDVTYQQTGGMTQRGALLEAEQATAVGPIAHAGIDQEVKQVSIVKLDGSGSRAITKGAIIVLYKWEQEAGPHVSLTDGNSSTPTFKAPAAATMLSFSLTVIDSTGMSSLPARVDITVKD